MDKYRSVHVTYISRMDLTAQNLQINTTNDKYKNANIRFSSDTNQNMTLNHSVGSQLHPPSNWRTSITYQSNSISPNVSNNNNKTSKNCLKNLNGNIFIIFLAIIIAMVTLISMGIVIYILISIEQTTTKITTSTTTTARLLVTITQTNDSIVGICNTIAGGSTGGSAVNYPASQNPPNAIDNSTSTKYLNFGNPSSGCSGSSATGIDTGYYITPSISNISVAVGLLFATANDSPNRDPITVTLEGSNATSTAALNSGSSWILIYNGSTGISPSIDPGRLTYVPQQNFSNTLAFSSYRLLITSKRGTDNSVQYSEAHIIGYI